MGRLKKLMSVFITSTLVLSLSLNQGVGVFADDISTEMAVAEANTVEQEEFPEAETAGEWSGSLEEASELSLEEQSESDMETDSQKEDTSEGQTEPVGTEQETAETEILTESTENLAEEEITDTEDLTEKESTDTEKLTEDESESETDIAPASLLPLEEVHVELYVAGTCINIDEILNSMYVMVHTDQYGTMTKVQIPEGSTTVWMYIRDANGQILREGTYLLGQGEMVDLSMLSGHMDYKL